MPRCRSRPSRSSSSDAGSSATRPRTWSGGAGIIKLTGCRETKPPYRVFRRGFTTDILELFQFVIRSLDSAFEPLNGVPFVRSTTEHFLGVLVQIGLSER